MLHHTLVHRPSLHVLLALLLAFGTLLAGCVGRAAPTIMPLESASENVPTPTPGSAPLVRLFGSRRLRQLARTPTTSRHDGRGLQPAGQPYRRATRKSRIAGVSPNSSTRSPAGLASGMKSTGRRPEPVQHPGYSMCGPIRNLRSPARSNWNSNVPVKSVSSACRASGPNGGPSASSCRTSEVPATASQCPRGKAWRSLWSCSKQTSRAAKGWF